ncbi:MAG: DUF4124 domain-containing protein [Arenimonas sp.]
MKIRSLLTLAIISSLLAGGLYAQEKKKLYRWVDKDGKVQISDQLPPEAVNQARKEINAAGQRTSSSTVDRALTEEERAAQAKLAEEQAAAQKVSDQQTRVEQAMLINYATEDDLRRTYRERIELLQQTIESTDVSIKSIRGSLTGMLAQASEAELTNRSIDAVRKQQIQELHTELLKQQLQQVASRADVKTMEDEFNMVLARYRELRGSAVPAPDTANPPPATTQTPTAPSK